MLNYSVAELRSKIIEGIHIIKYVKRKGISNLFVFFLKNSWNPEYCLKTKPERIKYNGIINKFKVLKAVPPDSPKTWSSTTKQMQNPFVRSTNSILFADALFILCCMSFVWKSVFIVSLFYLWCKVINIQWDKQNCGIKIV